MRHTFRILSVFLLCVFILSGSAQAKKRWKVAFLNQQLSTDMFNDIVRGRNEALSDCGLTEGKDYKIIMDKTFPATEEGGKAAAQAAMRALDKGVDLVVTMGTAPSVGARKVLMRSSVPQIYMAVSDPVASGIIDDYNRPTGTNVTGVSYWVDPHETIKLARALLPEGKKLAFVYMSTVSADLSRKKHFEELEAKGETAGFEIVYADILDDQAFLKQTANGPIADAWFVWLGFNYKRELVYKGIEGMPYIGSSQKLVMQTDPHSPASVIVDDYILGRQAGVMMVKVLKGEANVSEIPPEHPKKTDIYVNTTAALNYKDKIVLSYEILNEAREIFGEATSYDEWMEISNQRQILVDEDRGDDEE